MLKKILFPAISFFLAYKTYEILKSLWFLEPSSLSLLTQVALSFVLNLFVTGVFAFFGFAYKTNQLLGKRYYHISNPKFILQIYKSLQIEYFKKFLLFMFWGRKQNRQKYFNGTRLGLENFDYQTRQSEFGHLAALVFIQIIAIIITIKEHYTIALITTIINFISNFYPVILQRNHRINIIRLRNILNKRAA